MRLFLLIPFLFLVSCAHEHDGQYRMPASYAELVLYGDHDLAKSSVKVFPPEHHEKFTRHFYYVELKDEKGMYIDRDLHEIEVKIKKKKLDAKIERVLRGRFYVHFDADKRLSKGQLDFYVAGKKLRESFKLGLRPAHASHTKMRKLRATKGRAKFELVLKDKNGRLVETPNEPEIIADSGAQVSKLEHMGNGIWHITMTYPRGNHLFYITVRSYGVEFKNLFRFQYVDRE
jgi:hypothetical protein